MKTRDSTLMSALNLWAPMTPAQALVHIACGATTFLECVGSRSQLGLADAFLRNEPSAIPPSKRADDCKRLQKLRGAVCDVFDGQLDELELRGLLWIWLAMSRAPNSVHPDCADNLTEFIAERSDGSKGARIRYPAPDAKPGQKLRVTDVTKLLERSFDLERALRLHSRGTCPGPKQIAASGGWHCDELEDKLAKALDELAGRRKHLLTEDHASKRYQCRRLDRFDLFAFLYRQRPAVLTLEYTDSTLLRALTNLVACRRGRRPDAHPLPAPKAGELARYAKTALKSKEWLRYVGLRPRA